LFGLGSREVPVFVGQTGAKAGSGTSSVTGDVWLTVTGSAGNYSLSIDGGLSSVTTDGTDTNLAVTDSVTGKVLYVDTTEIATTGTGLVRVPGTHDIFGALITARDILRNERNLTDAELEELRASAAVSLDEMHNLLVQNEVSLGSRIGFLTHLRKSHENLTFNTEDQASEISQADVAQIAIDLSRREVLYQMSLSVAGKLMSLSLLDFIR
jgi:flagellin-like hook-associated protein FlgL